MTLQNIIINQIHFNKTKSYDANILGAYIINQMYSFIYR